MKLIIPFCIVGILLISSFGAGAANIYSDETIKENQGKTRATHTVLGEYGTATWCGYCKYAHGALKELYATGQYDFYYISLVTDKNTKANQRCISGYNAYGWPTLWWDGGYRVDVGAGSVAGAKAAYIASINACGTRAVKDVNIDLGVTWNEGTNIGVDVSVMNNEASTYDGHIRVYITEIVSSMGWIDSGGVTYTYPFLDYAFDEAISISAGGSWSDSTEWIGSANGFPSITETNIMIIAAVFNNEPHQGYSYPPSQNPFTAYYVDDVVGATPGSGVNSPPDEPRYPSPTEGQTDVSTDVDLSWVGSDPNNDDLTYDVYFGTNSQPPKVSTGQTASSYDPATLVNLTTYYWQVVVWDEHGESTIGPLWSFTTTSNYQPSKPNISGPASGKPGKDIEYTFTATDPNGDDLYYYIVWGDGTNSGWVGPSASGADFKASHQWAEKGTYIIKAKVKDPSGIETGYTSLQISIPRYKTVAPNLLKLLQHFQLFQLLKNFL